MIRRDIGSALMFSQGETSQEMVMGSTDWFFFWCCSLVFLWVTGVDDAGTWEALRKCRHTAGLPGRHISASLSKSLGSGQGDPVYTGRWCPGDRCNLHAGIRLQSRRNEGWKLLVKGRLTFGQGKCSQASLLRQLRSGKSCRLVGKKRHKCILLHSVYVNVFCRCCPCPKVRPLLTNLPGK